MAKVLIPNYSAHDFSDAENYGELVFMSAGKMNRFGVNDMHREFSPHIDSSDPLDWLLPTGLSIMGIVAASMFAHRHGRLNLLLYKNGGRYVERRIIL